MKQKKESLLQKPLMVSFFKGRFYYKLVPTLGYSNLEISGIKMYPNKDSTPDLIAEKKLKVMNLRRGAVILDICTGLGYTAEFAIKFGASKVFTIEKDINVIEIARKNPYSEGLFKGIKEGKIKSIIGDAVEIVKILPASYFHGIIHDPPRYGRAKELYSLAFYRDLFLLLKNRGKLLHYVGQPKYKYRGENLLHQTKKRLKETGFSKVIEIKELNSILAYK